MRFALLALLICCAAASADQVVLRNGAVLEGRVTIRGDRVAVVSSGGTVTIPRHRVAAVRREPSNAEPRAEQPARTAPASAADAPEDGAPALAQALNKRIDMDLQGATVYEFLQYLREETGINLAVTQVVRESNHRVDLNVEQVRALTLLRIVLKQSGFHAASRPDEVLYVSHRPLQRRMPSFEVQDLLVDWSDATGDDDGGDDQDDDGFDEEDDDGDGHDGRVDELRDLIEHLCGRRSVFYRGRLFVLPEGAREQFNPAPDRRR
jgi:hypothetical protein